MNEKRKQFIEQFAIQVSGIKENKERQRKQFDEQTKNMKPTIGEIADGYRSFISDLGEGFLEIAENYNMCLEIAKTYEIIGDVKLKARIKDFSSSRINTDKKILDDVFGMEIVTPTEEEKEKIMLFNHLIFDILKDKKYRRPTGYIAYHCMGDLSINKAELTRDELEGKIREIVRDSKTKELKRSKNDPKFNKDEDIKEVSIFPKLKNTIRDSRELELMLEAFEEMIEYMGTIKSEIILPIVEIQFKTAEVEANAIRGAAAHTKYKSSDEKMIVNKFKNGQLIRGINSPWKFEGTKSGLKLQDFYDTLMDNWPFLKDTIVERRNKKKENKDRKMSSQFDTLTASIFPFLRKYIPSASYNESKKEEIWGGLKIAMIVARLDETEPLEDELLAQIENIWGRADRIEDENGGHSL